MQASTRTIGEWLALWERDKEAASEALVKCGASVCASLRRKGTIGKSDAEDVSQEAVLRLIAEDARRLREASADAVLWAHFHGVARRVALEQGRSLLPTRDLREEAESLPGPVNEALSGSADLDLSRMTCRQREAFELHLRGKQSEDAARILNIKRQSYWSLLVRGGRRAVASGSDTPPDRRWARRVLASPEARLRLGTRETLRRFVAGESVSQIARAQGLTRQAVGQRIRRLRLKN